MQKLFTKSPEHLAGVKAAVLVRILSILRRRVLCTQEAGGHLTPLQQDPQVESEINFRSCF